MNRFLTQCMGRVARRVRRGFTLIEVLIGVLILALGVLGLGAIIPVVVRQQQLAADATLGIATANAAKGDLLRTPGFDPGSSGLTVWDAFLDNNTNLNSQWSRDGQWEQWPLSSRVLQNYLYTSPLSRQNVRWRYTFDGDDGRMAWNATIQAEVWNSTLVPPRWENQGPVVNRAFALPVASRMWPNASGQPIEVTDPGTDPYRPQFVWDIVCRRVPPDAAERAGQGPGVLARSAGTIEVALFVRRIDLSIRVRRATVGNPARPLTLWDVVSGWTGGVRTASNDRCVPVAMDRPTTTSSNRTSVVGLPTNRGNLTPGVRYYAEPIYLGATFDPQYPDQIRLNLPNTNDNRWRLASQPGQKLVDNLGNIYTVRGPSEDTTGFGAVTVIVDPPIPAWVPDPFSLDPVGLVGLNPAKLNQVVFTPQIPAAVSVFTITRPLN